MKVDSLNVEVEVGDTILFKEERKGHYETHKGTLELFFLYMGIDYVTIRTEYNTIVTRRLSEVSKDI